MDDAINSQGAIVFFLWKEGAPPIDISRRLSAVFGDNAMQQRTVYKWVERYASGRDSLEDDPRSGRQKTAVTPENIEAVNGLHNLTARWEKCIAIAGAYIEKFDADSDSDWPVICSLNNA